MEPSRLTFRWRIVVALVVAMVRLVRWRLEFRNLERVPRQGGAVLAFNHHSYADFLMVAWPVVRQLKRPVRFLAKREMWRSPATRWLVRFADAVPVDRDDPAKRQSAFGEAIASLRRGDLIAVAPEQTISPSFELLPFKTGAVRMAQQAGVPIIPAIGFGSHRFSTKGHKKRYETGIPVVVHYGEPLHVPADEDPREATERLRTEMAKLLDEVITSYPDTPRSSGAWWLPARLGGTAPDHEGVVTEHLERLRRRDGREAARDAALEERRDAS